MAPVGVMRFYETNQVGTADDEIFLDLGLDEVPPMMAYITRYTYTIRNPYWV